MTDRVRRLLDDIDRFADPLRALHAQRFFKTGPGQYGEGDVFIGITMPQLRAVCRQYRDMSVAELQELLDSPIHEHRMAALVIMSDVSIKAPQEDRQRFYDLYIENLDRQRINNWDLVDISARNVVGTFLLESSIDPLIELARSPDLWKKRVAIVATFAFVAHGQAAPTIRIAELLLHDSHDLIHKAVGWLLREAGKRVDEEKLTDFLDIHAAEMPRTMLRYAIERLPDDTRRYYLQLKSEVS